MTFDELIDKQKSSDYKERFIAEWQILYCRAQRLERIIKDEPTYDCDKKLLSIQLEIMKSYLEILEYRAIIEEVTLPIPLIRS